MLAPIPTLTPSTTYSTTYNAVYNTEYVNVLQTRAAEVEKNRSNSVTSLTYSLTAALTSEVQIKFYTLIS